MIIQDFFVVNSFAEKAFGGNPAAVFLDGEGLVEAVMQSIARQMNLIETVFVFRPDAKEKDLRFRYFTPLEELPVAGHPTIAAGNELLYGDHNVILPQFTIHHILLKNLRLPSGRTRPRVQVYHTPCGSNK